MSEQFTTKAPRTFRGEMLRHSRYAAYTFSGGLVGYLLLGFIAGKWPHWVLLGMLIGAAVIVPVYAFVTWRREPGA